MQTPQTTSPDPAAGAEIKTPRRVFKAHWSLFLPTMVIALLYLGGWAVLQFGENGGGAIARLMLIVGIVAPPVLLIHAVFRYQTIRLAVYDDTITLRRGASNPPERIEGEELTSVSVRRGLIGRWLDVGTLILDRGAKPRTVLRDISQPNAAAAMLRQMMANATRRS